MTMNQIEKVSIKEIKMNKNNPRVIKDDKYKKLVKSLRDFPQMLEVRPIVVDDDMVVLGGNMRLKACIEIGYDIVPIIKFSDLSEERKKEFIIKDNVGYGDWDNDLLSNWDKDLLLSSGLDDWNITSIFGINESENKYTGNIEGSNFNPEEVNVDDYIKTNILFLNDMMIEFMDDDVKSSIRNIKETSNTESFIEDLKKLILQYGKNPI